MASERPALLEKREEEGSTLATKLKNLHLTKVDFVDEGANQRADIKLVKRNASAGPDGGQGIGLFKRFLNWLIGEGYTMDEVKKAATSFDAEIKSVEMDKVYGEIYDATDAFRYSLDSIVRDDEIDAEGKAAAMAESLQQFTLAMQSFIPKWSNCQTVGIRKKLPGSEAGKPADKTVTKPVTKSEPKEEKGELEDMLKIDKSKMTPEERAAYDAIVKQYAVEVEDPEEVKKANAKKTDDPDMDDLEEEEAKKKTDTTPKQAAKSVEGAPEGADAVAKSTQELIAGLKAEVAKMKDEALTRDLTEVAKKYTVIGKKPEDLVPTLKSLKAAGGTAYDDMISLLDDMVSAQENSGVFGEIGKSRRGYTGTKSTSEAKIEGIAKSLMQENPSMTPAQALAKAWESHPELMDEYEEEAGF